MSVGHLPTGWSAQVNAVDRLRSLSFQSDRPFTSEENHEAAPGWYWLLVHLQFESNHPEGALALLWLKLKPTGGCSIPGGITYFLAIDSGHWTRAASPFAVALINGDEMVFPPLAISAALPRERPAHFVPLLQYRGFMSAEGWEIGPSEGATRLALKNVIEGKAADVILVYGIPEECLSFEIAQLESSFTAEPD